MYVFWASTIVSFQNQAIALVIDHSGGHFGWWAYRCGEQPWCIVLTGFVHRLHALSSSGQISGLSPPLPPPPPPPPSDLTKINLGLLRYVVGRNFYPTTHPVRALYARCNTIHWTEEEVSFDLNKPLLCLFSPTACLVGCWFYNCAPNLFIPLFIVICSFSLYM